MTYGHLQADCLYTGISSGPNARYRVWEAFTFTFTRQGQSPSDLIRSSSSTGLLIRKAALLTLRQLSDVSTPSQNCTRISCRWQTRATRCITVNMLLTN